MSSLQSAWFAYGGYSMVITSTVAVHAMGMDDWWQCMQLGLGTVYSNLQYVHVWIYQPLVEYGRGGYNEGLAPLAVGIDMQYLCAVEAGRAAWAGR